MGRREATEAPFGAIAKGNPQQSVQVMGNNQLMEIHYGGGNHGSPNRESTSMKERDSKERVSNWLATEWLETDGMGGFASSTASGQRTRRYHGLLLSAKNPPGDRVMLVNGFDAWVETPAGTFPISTQYYRGDVTHPDGVSRVESFTNDPWPTWRFRITDDLTITQEIMVCRGVQGVAVGWRVDGNAEGVKLRLRPLLSGRDFHGLHHANDDFDPATTRNADSISWQPYGDLPVVHAQTNGQFTPSFEWFYSFLYAVERDRGLDELEDLGSPGEFLWDLEEGEASLLLSVDKPFSQWCPDLEWEGTLAFRHLESAERDRRTRAGATARAIDSYIVPRGDGKTIIAGYPWFSDWGRDTFIAMRGLCLTRADTLPVAHDILLGWADTVSDGMLPNRFPDHGDTPEYNSVDASLWYVIAIHDTLAASRRANHEVPETTLDRYQRAIESILDGYRRGTRYGIRMEPDGLIAAGVPGVQLTWMDAKVDDWVVTPRIGKPVEIQALWLNALHVAGAFSDRWQETLELGKASFVDRFWNEEGGGLFDVVDCDHEAGRTDDALRPNQIFAVGGLPLVLLDDDRAASVVAAVESKLLTPLGLRSLSPDHPDYHPHYTGGILSRDGAYHQGTVWPWLIGPFVEAWLRVRDGSDDAKQEAAARFVAPLEAHLNQAGLGHISEVCDADPPHAPRGCPFQAWSLGEYLRIRRDMLGLD